METPPLRDTADKTMNTGVPIFSRPNCGLLGIQSPGAHTVKDKGGLFIFREFGRPLQEINGDIN